jgi:hypothetical protein
MITPETTLSEIFEFLDRGENAVQVVPMTVKQQSDDTRLAIFIHGEHDAASVIMAELMTRIDELFDLQAQAEAAAVEPKSSIITG